MARPCSYSPSNDRLSCDLLIAGAGIVGLWTARLADKAGLKVILLDKDRPGAGASGGLLGALMPHMPERWNPKKQFQLKALVSLGQRVEEIEGETGLACGYRRCGRLLPLAKPHHADLAVEREAFAAAHWGAESPDYSWTLMPGPISSGWPAVGAMPHGLVLETLAARVNPRLYLEALKASLGDNVEIIEGEALEAADDPAGVATTSRGRSIQAGKIVLSAGYASFPLLGAMLDLPLQALGTAIKGQAALLKAQIDPDWPLVFQNGTYVVPHEGGFVAVGSTSERQFEQPFETDGNLDDVISSAIALCPLLANAPMVEKWAGLRPKAIKRDPMIGHPPGCRNLVVATGGFKITFGIAHEMARCALAFALEGNDPEMPDSFRPEYHLR